jgi:hypothetical protein
MLHRKEAIMKIIMPMINFFLALVLIKKFILKGVNIANEKIKDAREIVVISTGISKSLDISIKTGVKIVASRTSKKNAEDTMNISILLLISLFILVT